MIVNDNAQILDKRGVVESFTVGASLLAMVVNDNAQILDKRGVLECFASKLAPTGPSALRPRVQCLSLPTRPSHRRLHQRVQVRPLMLRLPGLQFLAHARRPVQLHMIAHAEHLSLIHI